MSRFLLTQDPRHLPPWLIFDVRQKNMNTTFQVQWRRFFRSLATFMTIAIAIPVIFVCVLRVFRLGWDGAFAHISPVAFIFILLGIPVFSALCALPFAAWIRLASITVTDTEVIGRNFWGRKSKIPLSDIRGFERFSSNGINAIVVTSGSNGKIYINEHTECIDDLVTLLTTYIPKEE
jgi:hypothetical protein